ncbi:uncharacterized protein [Linepithema humile]|uniref:uncharacterized protein n=1 Tax=Linepithema humile TaxID=83485 RepID=UPI00351EEEB9
MVPVVVRPQTGARAIAHFYQDGASRKSVERRRIIEIYITDATNTRPKRILHQRNYSEISFADQQHRQRVKNSAAQRIVPVLTISHFNFRTVVSNLKANFEDITSEKTQLL